jgi:hypothetical protein
MAGRILLEMLHNVGLVVLPFTIYFFWKKIGQKISASYSWRSDLLVASGIGTITLINLKDRPVVIFSAHAVMDKFWFNLKRFDPPMILKPMEAVNIEADIVSKYQIDDEILEWKDPIIDKKRPITIYLSTSNNTIRCHRHQNPYIRELTYPNKHKLRIVKNYTSRFGDIIYNDDAKYALIYTQDNKRKTALIDRFGMIWGGGSNHWDYPMNAINVSDLESPDTVRVAIASSELANIISPFYVQSLSP